MGQIFMKRVIGSQGESKPLDLPISIQLTQPTPVRVGHLWIKADIASQITNIVIDRALKANVSEGTIQLIAQIDTNKLSITQDVAINTIKDVPLSLTTNSPSSKWVVSNVSAGLNIVQLFLSNYPLVYSTLSGVLDIETAYVWTGSDWELCSEKGAYAVYGNKVYEVRPVTKQFVEAGTLDGTSDTQISADGRYFVHGSLENANYKSYKRVGTSVSLLANVPSQFYVSGSAIPYNVKRMKLSKTGRIVCVGQASGAYTVGINVLDCTPTGLVPVQSFVISDTKLMESALYCHLFINEDASRIATFVKSDNTAGDTSAPVFIATARLRSDGIYEKTGRIVNFTNSAGTVLPIYYLNTKATTCQFYGKRLHVAFGNVAGYAVIDDIWDINPLPYNVKAFIDKVFVAPKVGVSFNSSTNLSVYYYDTELIESFTITWGSPSYPTVERTMCASLDGYVYILAKNEVDFYTVVCYKLVYNNGKISGATFVNSQPLGYGAAVKYVLGVSPTSVFN